MKDPNAHDTTERSVATGSHPQSDDSQIAAPNMGGNQPTDQLYTWLAGRLEGWKENDDYREFFEKGRSADGLNAGYAHDNDYDDNGGIPTGVGQEQGNW